MRTCLACRSRHDRRELLRFQLRDDSIVQTDCGKGAISGRSIYLCRNRRCLELILRRRELAFRHSKYAKIIVRLNQHQAQSLVRAFREIPAG